MANINVSKGFLITTTNKPLDGRTVVLSLTDIPNIQCPFIGMLFFVLNTGLYYKVNTLKSKTISGVSISNAQIDGYSLFREEAGTLTVGNVQTLSSSALAYVTNVGDSYDSIFDIGIPRGIQGIKGDVGNSGYTGDISTLELVNNLTQGGSTAALSAEMGKNLKALNTVNTTNISTLMSLVYPITDYGFYVCDANGHIGFQLDSSTLIDSVGLSAHFISLIQSISGIGLQVGETTGTAYDGLKGKNLAASLLTMNTKFLVTDNIYATLDTGFYICDPSGHIGASYTASGINFAKISSNAITVLNNAGIGTFSYETIETI